MGPDPARRVVSLTPSNTEILWALDALDRLAGADDHSDWPTDLDARGVARLGPDLGIDVDRVAACGPDLVLASLSVPGMESIVDGINELGLPTMVLAPKSFDDVFRDIHRVGVAVGFGARAGDVVDGLRARIAAVRAATDGARRRRVFWEWWPHPLITAGGGSWMTELIDFAGGHNVYADAPAESAPVDPGDVPDRRPEVVGACWCGTLQRVIDTAPARAAGRTGWTDMPAVRDSAVWPLDEALFGRPGPRLIEGLELLAWLLHPHRVPAPATCTATRGLVPRAGRATLATEVSA